MNAGIDLLGRWPQVGQVLREQKQLVVIRRNERLPIIHGQQRHILLSFIVSNDYMNLAIMTLPVSRYSEWDIHDGDEVVIVLKGSLTIRIPDSEETPEEVLYRCYTVGTGEKFFIPEGVSHQYINFSSDPVEAFVAIAPNL